MRPPRIAAEYRRRHFTHGSEATSFNEAAANRGGIRPASATPRACALRFNEAAANRGGIPQSLDVSLIDEPRFNEAAANRGGIQ